MSFISASLMPRCRTCRWWEEHGNPDNHEGMCRTDPNMEYMSHIPVRQGLPGVWAKHDEVRTRPDFGCVQHERKA